MKISSTFGRKITEENAFLWDTISIQKKGKHFIHHELITTDY